MHTVIYVAEIEHRETNRQSTSCGMVIKIDPAHYEVGFWEQADGHADNYVSFFHNVKSFADEETAYKFCNYLNGGNGIASTPSAATAGKLTPLSG